MGTSLSGDPEDLERVSVRGGSERAKKPLAEFLAEFERRLLEHPDEAATGASQAVADRAGGHRGSPVEISPKRQVVSVPVEEVVEEEPPHAGTADPPGPGGPAVGPGETRRLRGRRRRKHRHRAH